MSGMFSITMNANKPNFPKWHDILVKAFGENGELILAHLNNQQWMGASLVKTAKEQISAAIQKAINEAGVDLKIGDLDIHMELPALIKNPGSVTTVARDQLIDLWCGIFAVFGPVGLAIGGLLGPILKKLPPARIPRLDDVEVVNA
ncbi:MAG TPA: hypothetical protein VF678_12425 [bacterium]